MSKRKTVSIDLQTILILIKKECRNNTAFCEKMGRASKWVSDWKRGKNLPSPEEAAKMCAILEVSPEEILTEPADIELVRSLMKQEKPAQDKKSALDPYLDKSQRTEYEKEVLKWFHSLPEGMRREILELAKKIKD